MAVPNHIAFIMDGNATWAREHNKNPMEGYLKGMRTMADVILWAKELGISHTTFYAFSSENWQRPKGWISSFMKLAMDFFENDPAIKKVLDAKAKLKVIGDVSKLSKSFQEILKKYEKKTENNTGITVCLAVSYGSRDEIVRAAKKMADLGLDFTEQNFSENLDTAGIPDPELVVRTSFKRRLSNFLLWQISYAELYFSKLLWPDFSKSELEFAIEDFSKRERTYGK